MDYEKKYKEVLEKAKTLKEISTNTEVVGYMDELFPELKESEDERIKREIIEYVKIGTYRNDWLAWLEKQGQVKDSVISQHENKMCKENGDSLTNEDEMVRKELLAVVGDLVLPDDQQSRFVTWLEKQGEISPILSNSSNIGKVGDDKEDGKEADDKAENWELTLARQRLKHGHIWKTPKNRKYE